MATEKWGFDLVHSSIAFWVRHLMVAKVHGRFRAWNGSIEMNEEEPIRSRVDIQIETASVDTQDPQRDGHLRSADFFDVERFPLMSFRSTSVGRTAPDHFKITGDLTLRGVTKPVTLEVEYAGRQKDLWGGERAGFSARATINRTDFGLMYNQTLESGGVLVSERVEIVIEAEAVKAKG